LQWELLWPQIWRVLKTGCAVVIHSSRLFTDDLIATQRRHFRYKWYWLKDAKTGHLFSKKQPMRQIEELCVFYKAGGSQCYKGILSTKTVPTVTKNTKGTYFSRTQDKQFTTKYNYKDHLLRFKRRQHRYSTRPVQLCEFIIDTYTQPNDLVLDLTCSDGQCAIACHNLDRQYKGVDINPNMIHDARLNFIENLY
jgi:DNA modification methylase